MIQSIIDHKPDIIGFQEPRQEQVDDLSIGLAPLWNCTSQLIWKGGDVRFRTLSVPSLMITELIFGSSPSVCITLSV